MPFRKQPEKGDKGLFAEDLAHVFKTVQMLDNLSISGGSYRWGASGLEIAIPEAPEIFIGKASETDGGYPTFDNDRKIFPVQCYIDPSSNSASPTAALSFHSTSVPEVQVYNLAHCWIFKDSYIPVIKLGGFYWTWNNQKRTGQASAAITKGNLGNVVVQSLTIQARAKFADTANGSLVSVYHDGTEWVIDAEECP